MSDLMTIATIARAVKLSDKTVLKLLEDLNVPPIHVARNKRSSIRLYEPSAVNLIKEHLKAQQEEKSPAPVAADDRLNSIAVAVADVYDKLELVSQQHASLLRAVERTREDVMAAVALVASRVDAIQKKLDAVEGLVTSAQPAAAAPAPAPAPVAPALTNVVELREPANDVKDTRKHVAILALPNNQRDTIKKEFKDVFKLEFFESDEVSGRGFGDKLQRFDAVLGMTGFLNHGITSVQNKAGSKFIRVSGGVSSLRDKLTELFVRAA